MNREKTNIILINCDDLGYGDLGCYGSEMHDTPHIDRMAAEGVRFTDFYMAAPVCSASRAGMLTGCYPKRINFPGVLHPADSRGLAPSEITIARLLRDAGYATQLVGKWHCGDQPAFLPTNHGFGGYYGLPYSNDMGRNRGAGPEVPPLPLLDNTNVIQEQPDQTSLTERYVEHSLRFIRDNRDGPFFLYLAHMYVHVPLYVPDRFMKDSRDGLYGGAVSCLDWAAGVILHELKSLDIDENTLIIFTSDNGARWTSNDGNRPLRGCKGTTWEGGMRVPCIMRWPGRIPAGRTSRSLTTAMDFYPTLAALTGMEMPDDRVIDGKVISGLMFSHTDAAEPPRNTFFFYLKGRLEAVRCGKWKLHVAKSGRGASSRRTEDIRELYDLESDIGESMNLYESCPDVVEELMSKIEACRLDMGDEVKGVEGENVRPCGYVENPRPLTRYDENHPYMIEEYDLKDERA